MTMPPIANALLLAEDESLVSVDRAVLRRLGVTRVRFLSCGQYALHVLKSLGQEFPPLDMIICHERLADMTGFAFLQSLRQDSALRDLPMVLLAGNRESTLARNALAFGGCALLARPYTQDGALAALRQALSSRGSLPALAALAAPAETATQSTPAEAAQAAFSAQDAVASALPIPAATGKKIHSPGSDTTLDLAAERSSQADSRAELFFRHGLKAMREEDLTGAEKALKRAFALDPLHAEACLALSKVNKNLGLEKESQAWLCRSGVACLRRHEPGRAHDIFSRLPRVKDGVNPLLPEATRLLQEGEAKAAAFAFLEAQTLEPERPLHSLIGRASLFTDAPEEAMRSLCRALAREGYESTARNLQHRLFSDMPLKKEAQSSPFWDRFPVLRDIVSVASFTFSAWKQAA